MFTRQRSIAQGVMTLLCIVSLVLLPLQQALAATITKEYYHYNHQNSLIGVYDGEGNELLIQRWTPWGERQVLKTSAPASSTGALLKHGLPAHMGYTGHKDLVAAGLVFMGDTRLYSPKLKRFPNPDDRTTGGIRGENRSSYAYNNPISYTDPDGHRPLQRPFAVNNLRRTMPSLRSTKGIKSVMMPVGRKGVLHSLSPNFAASDDDLIRAGVAAGVGFSIAGGGFLPRNPMAPFMFKAAAPLIASPIRSLAAFIEPGTAPLKGGAGLARNAAYVFGGNLIGALPLIGYKGLGQHQWRGAGLVVASSLILSAGIFLADRLFVVDDTGYSVASVMRAHREDSNVAISPGFAKAIYRYSMLVGIAAFGSSYVGSGFSTNLRAHAISSLLAMVYPLSFLPQARNAADVHSGGLQRWSFKSRFILASFSTSAAVMGYGAVKVAFGL